MHVYSQNEIYPLTVKPLFRGKMQDYGGHCIIVMAHEVV
jgi:hypothetical protein